MKIKFFLAEVLKKIDDPREFYGDLEIDPERLEAAEKAYEKVFGKEDPCPKKKIPERKSGEIPES